MKVEIGKLPEGYKLEDGKVVRTYKHGGTTNKTLQPVDRDVANLEAEKNETALTDLDDDGSFELYNIGGKRHTEGGTPLNLPEQSFVFSDTRAMLLSKEELAELGIISKKKMTPAAASKKFPLNEYIEIINDPEADKIAITTAEEMIDKNKIKLSQIAFIQESKKDFSDGLPLASYPFLIDQGIDPQEIEAKIAEKNNPQQGPQGGPMHQMPDGSMMPGATHGEAPQMSQQQMAMGPQQGGLQEFTGPPQGPPQGGQQMPPPEMMQQMMAQQGQGGPPMGRHGTEMEQPEYKTGGSLPKYSHHGEVIPLARKATSLMKKINPFKFSLTDNMWLSKGAYTQPTTQYNWLNQSNENLGFLNVNNTKGALSNVEMSSTIPEHQRLGIQRLLYDRAITSSVGNSLPIHLQGLISGQDLQNPEATIGLWDDFEKSRMSRKFPWIKKKFNLDAGDYDFSKDIVGGKYTGDPVLLKGLTDAGKLKVDDTKKFFHDLDVESGLNTKHYLGTKSSDGGYDVHSPLWRGIKSKFSGEDVRIGNNTFGQPKNNDSRRVSDYSAGQIILPATALAYWGLSGDNMDADKQAAYIAEQIKKKADELKITVPEYEELMRKLNTGDTTLPEAKFIDIYEKYKDSTIDRYGREIKSYLRGGGTASEGAVLCDAYDKPIDPQMAWAADGNKNYRGPGMKFGGDPFSPLRKFTDGGQQDPMALNGQGQVSETQQMLMQLQMHKEQLMQQYGQIQAYVEAKPNVLEDPEQAYEIQGQIQQIEAQLQQIEAQSNQIQQQLFIEQSQIDPFADPGAMAGGPQRQQQPSMMYGGGLPKFQNAGELWKDWIVRENARPENTSNPRYVKKVLYGDVRDESKFVDQATGFVYGADNIPVSESPYAESSYTHRSGAACYDVDNVLMASATDATTCASAGGDWKRIAVNPYQSNTKGLDSRSDAAYATKYAAGQCSDSRYTDQASCETADKFWYGAYDQAQEDKYTTGSGKHQEFYDIMNKSEFSGVRERWIEAYKQNSESTKVPFDNEHDLFEAFNTMNLLFQVAEEGGVHFADGVNFTDQLKANAERMGLPVPDDKMIKQYQGMYNSLAQVKENGTDADKELLENVNMNYSTTSTGGAQEITAGSGFYVSKIDGLIGDNTSQQFASVVNPTTTTNITTEHTVECTADEIAAGIIRCREESTDLVPLRFDKNECDCVPKGGSFKDPKYPRYETFDQDDLAVAVKSGQFPNLMNPTLQGTPDPAMVDPMYVDPRQQLSSMEATAAAAMRANPDQATSIMGKMQDASEDIINKHEGLNTKIYNNAQNVNVSALNEFTGNNQDRFKTYMDETAMAAGNYDTEYKNAEDALLDAEQTQMSNADEMYIRNLENPNYWFSPKDHNIEYYNQRNIDGSITAGGGMTPQEASDWCTEQGYAGDVHRKCVNDRTVASSDVASNTQRASERNGNNEENNRMGTEVGRNNKRKAELARSRSALKKWITGH